MQLIVNLGKIKVHLDLIKQLHKASVMEYYLIIL